ncbi:MAG: hypothetical protein H6Q99_2785 [Proteobacteria bacterium]|nr:hypothetical protein [Pseudomonadota bacterium]
MSSQSSFERSPYRSIKNDSYFPAYDKLLSKYRGKQITIAEIGVLGGGSLFMWRDFFGPSARIIGIDLNPAAIKWREHGYEIFIGNQESDDFWDSFFSEVGKIDVLVDDGGHTNYQQLKTLHKTIPRINDGGVVLIEDTQTSYMKSFGNPSPYSFMNFCAEANRRINDRYFYKDNPNLIRDYVHSVEVFDGMVGFHINQPLCIRSKIVVNSGYDDNSIDFRVGVPSKNKGVLNTIIRKIRRKIGQYKEKIKSFRKCRPYFKDFI